MTCYQYRSLFTHIPLPDSRGKATSRRCGWIDNPVSGTQAPLCTDTLSSQLVCDWSPCPKHVRTSWKTREHGWLWGFPASPLSRLCSLHDHWRHPSKAERSHWIGGAVVSSRLKFFNKETLQSSYGLIHFCIFSNLLLCIFHFGWLINFDLHLLTIQNSFHNVQGIVLAHRSGLIGVS